MDFVNPASDQNTRAVVGLGILNQDLVAVVPKCERDQKSDAQLYYEQPGGPVHVALLAFARLQKDDKNKQPLVSFGILGQDDHALSILKQLKQENIDTTHLQQLPNHKTNCSLVMIDQRDGTRTIATYQGTPQSLTLTKSQEELLKKTGLLHIDGRYLPTALAAAKIVKENGGLVSYDLGTMRPGCEQLFPFCDIIISSKKGGSGAFPDISEEPFEQTKRFLKFGPKVAGVTLGQQGLVIATKEDGPVLVNSFQTEKVVDTCGAGDCFHGAFLYKYYSGSSPIEALNLLLPLLLFEFDSMAICRLFL